jgi:hypothetical protein
LIYLSHHVTWFKLVWRWLLVELLICTVHVLKVLVVDIHV